MLASNGTSQPLPNSNGGICSHCPPHWRSLRVFYSLGFVPFSRLKGKSCSSRVINIDFNYFCGITLNPHHRTTIRVHLHSTFQLRQCAHPLWISRWFIDSTQLLLSLTPALRCQSRTCTSKTSITFDSVSQSPSLACYQATTALLWRDLNPLTCGLQNSLPHMIPVIIISE